MPNQHLWTSRQSTPHAGTSQPRAASEHMYAARHSAPGIRAHTQHPMRRSSISAQQCPRISTPTGTPTDTVTHAQTTAPASCRHTHMLKQASEHQCPQHTSMPKQLQQHSHVLDTPCRHPHMPNESSSTSCTSMYSAANASHHIPKQQLQHQITVVPHVGALTRLTNSSSIKAHNPCRHTHAHAQTTTPASTLNDVLSTATAVRLQALPRTPCYKFCLLHGYHANCSFTGLLAEV